MKVEGQVAIQVRRDESRRTIPLVRMAGLPLLRQLTQIIDRAWDRIVAKHPELDTSPANRARALAEIDLKRSCPPRIFLAPAIPPSSGAPGDRGTAPRTGERGSAAGSGNVDERVGPQAVAGHGQPREAHQNRREHNRDTVSSMRWDTRGEVNGVRSDCVDMVLLAQSRIFLEIDSWFESPPAPLLGNRWIYSCLGIICSSYLFTSQADPIGYKLFTQQCFPSTDGIVTILSGNTSSNTPVQGCLHRPV